MRTMFFSLTGAENLCMLIRWSIQSILFVLDMSDLRSTSKFQSSFFLWFCNTRHTLNCSRQKHTSQATKDWRYFFLHSLTPDKSLVNVNFKNHIIFTLYWQAYLPSKIVKEPSKPNLPWLKSNPGGSKKVNLWDPIPRAPQHWFDSANLIV